jgi:hypothetical protein
MIWLVRGRERACRSPLREVGTGGLERHALPIGTGPGMWRWQRWSQGPDLTAQARNAEHHTLTAAAARCRCSPTVSTRLQAAFPRHGTSNPAVA